MWALEGSAETWARWDRRRRQNAYSEAVTHRRSIEHRPDMAEQRAALENEAIALGLLVGNTARRTLALCDPAIVFDLFAEAD